MGGFRVEAKRSRFLFRVMKMFSYNIFQILFLKIAFQLFKIQVRLLFGFKYLFQVSFTIIFSNTHKNMFFPIIFPLNVKIFLARRNMQKQILTKITAQNISTLPPVALKNNNQATNYYFKFSSKKSLGNQPSLNRVIIDLWLQFT